MTNLTIVSKVECPKQVGCILSNKYYDRIKNTLTN